MKSAFDYVVEVEKSIILEGDSNEEWVHLFPIDFLFYRYFNVMYLEPCNDMLTTRVRFFKLLRKTKSILFINNIFFRNGLLL